MLPSSLLTDEWKVRVSSLISCLQLRDPLSGLLFLAACPALHPCPLGNVWFLQCLVAAIGVGHSLGFAEFAAVEKFPVQIPPPSLMQMSGTDESSMARVMSFHSCNMGDNSGFQIGKSHREPTKFPPVLPPLRLQWGASWVGGIRPQSCQGCSREVGVH